MFDLENKTDTFVIKNTEKKITNRPDTECVDCVCVYVKIQMSHASAASTHQQKHTLAPLALIDLLVTISHVKRNSASSSLICRLKIV